MALAVQNERRNSVVGLGTILQLHTRGVRAPKHVKLGARYGLGMESSVLAFLGMDHVGNSLSIMRRASVTLM
jgi:hypothetical protein